MKFSDEAYKLATIALGAFSDAQADEEDNTYAEAAEFAIALVKECERQLSKLPEVK